TMDANKTVVANFTEVLYSVTENVEGGGSVLREPDASAYAYGTTVTVTAVPTDEWHFDQWTGAVTGSSLSESFVVTGAMAYTAHFTQWYPLKTAIVGEGGVARNPSGEYFEPGTPVTLTATPMAGWRFDFWSGDLTGSTNPETVTMDAAKTVTATFVPDTYTVTTRVEGAGSVDGGGTYPAGAEVTLTPKPDLGWDFVGWSGDVTSIDDPLVLILKTDLDVVANFAPSTYVLDVTIEGVGSVELDPSTGPYAHGTTVSLTPVADAGWHFDQWTGDLSGSDVPGLVTMDANKAVTATFVQDTVTYTVTTHVDGDGEVLGGGTYEDGATATLTAVADPGSTFDHWSGDADGSNATIELTVTSNLDVTAHFVATGHTLDVTAQGEGYVVVEPSPGPYADGTAVTLEAISASGWYFQGWTGAITSPANPVTLEMHDSMAITANFLPEVGPLVTVALDGAGHVTSVPEGIDCGTTGGVCRASFPRNTKLTLTGVADDGAAFLRWTGTVPGIEPDLNVRLREDVTVTAHFVALNGAEVAIDPVGSFRGNTAVVTGSLVCESDSYDLDVSIVQVVPVKKGEPVRVSASATVIGAVCGQPWMATLVADTDRFTRGEAEVTVIVDGDTRTRTIELR
ncbi:MAG: InlB B-repeat-containing protein, partial [Trueperaceae bacterium]